VTLQHQFGGQWTEEKLNRLRKYLPAYTKIFQANERAKFLTTYYVDAFAGTGYRSIKGADNSVGQTLFGEDEITFEDQDAESFNQGSAKIALEVEPSFDNYIFVEQNSAHVEELENLQREFPTKANQITILQDDANTFLQMWCARTNWQRNRAIVFLDPYGMSVEWTTIEAVAKTKAIDFWILFPLGQAVNRLLIRKHPPEGAWANKLTRFFGTEDWKTEFYRPRQRVTLFEIEETLEKEANFESIGKFFVKRLESIFTKVAQNPLTLYNSRNVPIYLLCFAAGNPKGAPTAVRIANDILKG